MAEALRSASTLPQGFFRAVAPAPVEAPRFVARNEALAHELGLPEGWFETPEALAALSGNAPFDDQSPVALAYAGHQFGGFVPQLGDGRAHLIATRKRQDGQVVDLQLKGSGPTPFSRNGDGRATLSAMLREYLVSEAMYALGIPTTRSLAVVATGEDVYRRRREPGAVLTRVAKSHVRVGTFQYASVHLGREAMEALVDHELARNYPDAPQGEGRFRWFLAAVITRQAQLIPLWMQVGFIHGVMNTDNMAVSGETIDYGPCAFMDSFHPRKTFSSIDHHGRYAWDQQPGIALWNLTRLAEALLPLLHPEQDNAIAIANAELAKFYQQFEPAVEDGMLRKLGIVERRAGDEEFIAGTLKTLMQGEADYTLFFRRLTQLAAGGSEDDLLALFNAPAIATAWLEKWRSRLESSAPDVAVMRRANPVYIPRNHQVEAALTEAERGNFTRLNTLAEVLAKPFDEQFNRAGFEAPPLPEEEVQETFCGT